MVSLNRTFKIDLTEKETQRKEIKQASSLKLLVACKKLQLKSTGTFGRVQANKMLCSGYTTQQSTKWPMLLELNVPISIICTYQGVYTVLLR